MSPYTLRENLVVGSIVAGVALAAPVAQAQHRAAVPDFSSNNVGWVGLNGGGPFYEPVPGRVPPVSQDAAHPFVPNGVGKQPTYRIADLSNPILKPWPSDPDGKGHEDGGINLDHYLYGVPKDYIKVNGASLRLNGRALHQRSSGLGQLRPRCQRILIGRRVLH